ncbi:MAG: hypothetical protein DVB26_02385 [Verrucomicrobia bacterium]|nr:MAG: hypothetical protein DVB26_02385 [Verrucomicrobiota bacterium]
MTTDSTDCCKATDSTASCKACPGTDLGLFYGAFLLRIWLAVRTIQTGLEKYVGTVGSDQPVAIDGKPNGYGLTAATNLKEYALSHYHGVPEGLFKKFATEPLMRLPAPIETGIKECYKSLGGKFSGEKLADAPAAWAKFLEEPVMLNIYNVVLGPALLVLGFMILFGIASRTSLFLLGLLYISLTWGLILIKEDSGIAWLGIHMVLVVMALMLAKYNRLCLLKKW